MTAAAARVDLSSAGGGGGIPGSGPSSSSSQPGYSGPHQQAGVAGAAADQELGMAERALSAAGAAFVSAIIVNPLDVAKVGVGGLSLPPRALVWLVAESFFVFFFSFAADEIAGAGGGGALLPAVADGVARPGRGNESDDLDAGAVWVVCNLVVVSLRFHVVWGILAFWVFVISG